MKKSLVLLTVFALTASTTSIVFANEGAETPDAEVSISVENGEAQAEPMEVTSLEGEVATVAESEGTVSESPNTGYSEELLSDFSTKIDLIHTSIYHGNYTTESSQKALSMRQDAINLVGPHWEAGTLKDKIIHEGIRLADLALASLVPETPAPEQPEQPNPGETPEPENPGQGEQPKQGETPKPETPKEDKGNTNSSSKEAEATTKPEAQGEAKATLPATGEADSFAIFSAAALTILASVGMLAYGKREEV